MEVILSIDQGTTNTKAVLVDAHGVVVASASAPVGTSFPRVGWVEQDAIDIWHSTLAAIRDCLAAADGVTPVALALCNQRESVVGWDRGTGRPVGPVLSWQDARTSGACARLVAAGHLPVLSERTGLWLDPMFSAPKMTWLRESSAGVAASTTLALGTVDAWLIYQLTGGEVFACEAGNASRTLLYDLTELDWHDDLLGVFGISRPVLPEVRASDAGFGVTADVGVLPAGLPISAVLADSHAALFYHDCRQPGLGKATYGTGSSIMTPTDTTHAAPAGIATTLAWLTREVPTYAREGNIIATGAALAWMAMALGLDGAESIEGLAAGAPDAGGAHFVPAFSGLGAPYWDRTATGVLTGISGGTTRAHLAVSALESVGHQVADVVEAIESDGDARIEVLRADGGATANTRLMQIQADLLGRPVRVANSPEASALGVAMLAAQTRGWPIPAVPADGVLIEPHVNVSARAARRSAWTEAVARSRGGLALDPAR